MSFELTKHWDHHTAAFGLEGGPSVARFFRLEFEPRLRGLSDAIGH